jgi:hypothetical protein
MSRIREYGKIYSWGCEKPGVALDRARRRKEKLLAEIYAIDERKQQEAERAKAAKRKKIEECDLVISMIIQYQADRALKPGKDGACDDSNGRHADTEALYPDISKASTHRNMASSHTAGSASKIEPILEKATPPSKGKRIVVAEQATCSPNRGVSSRNDVEAMAVLHSTASNGIALSDTPDCEGPESILSQAGRIERAPAEHGTAKVDPGAQLGGGDCSPKQDEPQGPNRECSMAQQTNVNKKADSKTLSDIQSLKRRKRELEEAQESLHTSNGGRQPLWTAEHEAEDERLDQELNAISRELDELGLRSARSMNPSSYSS